jgi:hypothetical protein
VKTNELLEKKGMQIGILAASVLFVLFLFIWIAYRLQLGTYSFGYDWELKWRLTRNGHVSWEFGLFNPPWTVIFFLPLGFLPMPIGWGVMGFSMAVALTLAVPRRQVRQGLYVVLVLASALSPLAWRNYSDGNIDGLLLIGLLLLVYGYREEKPFLLGLGVLLATIKPQAVVFLLLILPVYLIQTKTPRFYLKAGLLVLVVAVVSFLALQPAAWLKAMFGVSGANRAFGIALSTFLINLGAPSAVVWVLRLVIAVITLFITLSHNRELSFLKIAMLVAGSLLIAPYAGALTLIVILAFGVIPLMVTRPILGILLYGLYAIPYIFRADPVFWRQTYWTILLFASWALFAYLLATDDKATLPVQPTPESSPT